MRKLAIAVTSTVAVTAFVVAPPAAWATHDLDDFTVYAKITDFDKEDNGKEGWSKGDKVSFEADLFESPHDRAGDADGVCEFVDVDRDDHEFEADCKVVLDLDDGEIKVAGTVDEDDFDQGEIKLPIRDGSGDYDGAKGKVTFEPLHHHGHHRHPGGHGHGHGGHGHGGHGHGHGGGHGHGHGHGGHGHGHGGHGHGDHHDAPIIKVSVDFD